MAPPQRTADNDARQHLHQLRKAARIAEDLQWSTAAQLIHDERLTGDEAAHALGVSDSTFWRRIRPWAQQMRNGDTGRN